jgi:hypothetical protein
MSDYIRSELMQNIEQLRADFPALELTNRKVLDGYSDEVLDGVLKSISRQIQREIDSLGLEVPCGECNGGGRVGNDQVCGKCGGRGRIPSIAGTLLLDFISHHLSATTFGEWHGKLYRTIREKWEREHDPE